MSPDLTRREVLRGCALAAGATLLSKGALASVTVPDGKESAQVRETLATLLARNRQRDPEYGGGLSNHMSMALSALVALGASAERLQEFETRHARRLEPFPAAGPAVPPDTWRGAIGRPEAFTGLVQVFEADVRERGRDAVLRDTLPALVPGLGGAAFHGMIRTAYAVRAEDDLDVAHGLAYWAARAAPLGPLAASPGGEPDPGALLERVRADERLGRRSFPGGLIIDDMLAASALPGFADAANALSVADDTLDRLALAMLDLYDATHDFTALHAVTSTHALRVLAPYLSDVPLAVRCHWQALVAAYIGIGTPEVGSAPAAASRRERSAPPAWPAIAERAIASEDEHTIKLVDSCRQEQLARGGDLYAAVAAGRAGL
jgi:hypothetical protein